MAKPTPTTPDERPKRAVDPELKAMSQISAILSTLDGDQTKRILLWLTSRMQEKMYGRPEPWDGPPPSVSPDKEAA